MSTYSERIVFKQRASEKKSKEIEILHVNPRFKQRIWEEILRESEENYKDIQQHMSKNSQTQDIPLSPPMEYMDTKLLILLKKGVEEMISKAVLTDSLINYRSTFNGLDDLSEFLWNSNPMHPKRASRPYYIFDMSWVKIFLNKYPREYFPLSWIYTKDIAAKIIQRTFRGYIVRKRADVQEMRDFWKIIRDEQGEGTIHKRERKSVHIETGSFDDD